MAALIQAEASKHGVVVHALRDLDRRRFLGTEGGLSDRDR